MDGYSSADLSLEKVVKNPEQSSKSHRYLHFMSEEERLEYWGVFEKNKRHGNRRTESKQDE